MGSIQVVKALRIAELPLGAISRLRIEMVANGLGQPIMLPVVVVRGSSPGPVIGLTAAIHGNELNGVRVIQNLMRDLDPSELRGTVVACPVVNVPGFLQNQRVFNDGQDLNRLFPGSPRGNSAEIYAHRFVTRVLGELEYLIDLHTASFGRVNSLYVRADLTLPETAWMARAQHPQILVHNAGADGTLRAAAVERGIPAITVEVGDPQRFQRKMIRYGLIGVLNVLAHLKMVPFEEELPSHEPVICSRSYWLYTDAGGLLDVPADLGESLGEGQLVGRVTNVFGDVLGEYTAPEPGIVVGKSTNPVNQTGARILHLGVPGAPKGAA